MIGWLLAAGLGLTNARAQDSGEDPAREAPLVAATFHPWYDAPDVHFRAGDRDLLRHHFVEPSFVHPDSVEWYERELADVAAAGIDAIVVAAVARGERGKPWMPALRAALDRRAAAGGIPVRVALLLDPWLVALERSERSGTPAARLDLEDAEQRTAFLAPIDEFFAVFRPTEVASVGGDPLVVIAGDGAVGRRPDSLFDDVESRVEQATGRTPWLVVERSWNRLDHRAWRHGSGLLGPQRLGEVVSIGPGYDDRVLPRGEGIVRLRERGAAYAAAWRAVLEDRPRLVLLESWNQMHDGTALCVALEHGRAYVEATRRFTGLLRDGRTLDEAVGLRFDGPLLATAVVDGRDHVLADEARFEPGVEDGGLSIAPVTVDPRGPTATLAFERDAAGAGVLRIAPSGSAPARARFAVATSFVAPQATEYEVTIVAESLSGAAPIRVRLAAAGSDGAALTLSPTEGAGRSEAWRSIEPLVAGRELVHGLIVESEGTLRLSSLVLTRRSRTLPRSSAGISESGALDLEPAAVARLAEGAASLRAGWLRLETSWTQLAAGAAITDVSRIETAARIAREHGLEPLIALVEPPPELAPVAAHPREVGELVGRIAAECPSLRLLELLPRANVPEGVAAAADLVGHLRLLRAAASAAHAANPHLALVAGGIDGADTTWLRHLAELREPFAYDALVLLADDEMGEPGSRTFAHELGRFAGELARGPDRRKPWLVAMSATTARSPLLEPTRRPLLPRLIETSWRLLERRREPVGVLVDAELPRVRGLSGSHAVELLRAGGLEARGLELEAMLRAIADGSLRTLLLAHGEVVPAALIPALPRFVDGGGLLVTLGGAPFRRSAIRLQDGGYRVEEHAAAPLELRDDLRIALSRAPRRDGPASAIAWSPGPTAPELGGAFELPPGGARFTERTGQPRTDQGLHRYVPLVTAREDAHEIGELAVLLAYTGAREGALLLIGVDADDHAMSEAEQADSLETGFELAEERGARVRLWRGLIDRDSSVGGSLLRHDGTARLAAQAFAGLEAAGRSGASEGGSGK